MSVQLIIYFTDDTNITVNQDRLASGSPIFSDATSKAGSFEIGTAKVNECQVQLRNLDGFFNEYNFFDSYFKIYIDGEIQGKYYTNVFSFSSGILTLSGYDDMIKAEEPFIGVEVSAPITAGNLLYACCNYCGIGLESTSFINSDHIITRLPDSESITVRQIIAYIAQIAGGNARIKTNENLVIDWYELPNILNGGIYDNKSEIEYLSGDTLDGNNDSYDGGTGDFNYEHIYKVHSANINNEDIIIGGLEVHALGTESDYGESYLVGDESYVLIIRDNPLITEGNAETICKSIAPYIVGLKFRPMTINCMSNYKVRAPKVAITSIKGNDFVTIINSSYFVYKKAQELSCQAETPLAKKLDKGNEVETAVRIAKKNTEQLIKGYDASIQLLTNLMTYSLGVFPSYEIQSNGSKIYYFHDSKDREDSTNIWKIASDAFAVSSDGGVTWNAGLTAEGEFTSAAINTGLLRADFIRAGSVITNFFEAKNLKISGGSMDVTTDDASSQSKIIFTNNYNETEKVKISISASGCTATYYVNDVITNYVTFGSRSGNIVVKYENSFLDISAGILEWYYNSALKFSMDSSSGDLWVAGNVSAQSFTDRA